MARRRASHGWPRDPPMELPATGRIKKVAGSLRSWRPTRPSGHRVATVAVVGITLIAVGVAAPWAWRGPSASPSPPAASTESPPAIPTASPDEVWESVDLLPLAPAATLVPQRADTAGVAPDTTFVLTSLTDEPAAALAGRLETEPAVDLAVAVGPDERTVVLTPTGGLKTGAQYRATLAAPDGSLAGSWAFRVRGPVRVQYRSRSR